MAGQSSLNMGKSINVILFAAIGTIIAIIGSILITLVGIVALNQFAPAIIENFSSLVTTLTAADWGDPLGNSIFGISLLILVIGAPLAFLGMVVTVVIVNFSNFKATKMQS